MIKVTKYRDTPSNRSFKERCLHCQYRFPKAEMTGYHISSSMYSRCEVTHYPGHGQNTKNSEKVSYFLCDKCATEVAEKLLHTNLVDYTDNAELVYENAKMHRRIELLRVTLARECERNDSLSEKLFKRK